VFYCEECRVKNGWPESIMGVHSFGCCEVCAETAPCWDVPSWKLPKASIREDWDHDDESEE
jgi:hypothetical protein